jgi:hypothetical protein
VFVNVEVIVKPNYKKHFAVVPGLVKLSGSMAHYVGALAAFWLSAYNRC